MIKNYFQGKKVLITGGLGFIGSNLAHELVRQNAKVTLIDALIPRHGGNLFNINDIKNRVRLKIADVRDQQSICRAVKGQEYLFNLAGQRSHLDSMVDPYTDLETNCRGSLTILEACRKVNPKVKVIYTSTRQIYGAPSRLPVTENHPIQPKDVNGIHKLAAEWYHILYSKVYGIKTCVLRLTNTYGPRMRVKDARQTFLGWWLRQIISDKEIQVYGDGEQLRDFNYIDDVVNALVTAAASEEAYGKIFNLGSPAPLSLKALASLLVRISGKGRFVLVPFPPEQKAIDIGDYYADFSLIRKKLGWRPRISLEKGLTETIKYYRENHGHYW